MKIAHLDSGRSWRGGQAQVRFLMRGLRERGHESVLLAPRGPLAERAGAEGFRVVRWESHGEWDLAAMLSASRALGRERPDVAHAHGARPHALGVPAARLARVPAVVVSRRVDFAVGGNPLSALKYRAGVDRYLCISRGVRDVLRAGGVEERRLALVPSGIELARLPQATAEDLRAMIGAPAGAPVVGTVAALAPHKDHETLLRAAAIVVRAQPGVQFAWLGDGECRAALERERRHLGLEDHVHLLGFREDARALIPQFTLFALSSHLEGLCTSLLDAQALGVPIVATAVGGIPDVVQDGVTGRLVPPRQPETLAAALQVALARDDLRRAWAERARDSVKAFDVAHMVESTLGVYQEVLNERGPGHADR
jgi:glycosyltransferase involved in cell wall biosynthesis